MKLVEAIIQPHHLTAVLTALERVNVERLTVLDGFSDREETADDPHCSARVLRNVILEIVVNDDFLDRTVAAISVAARSGLNGRDGDGKVLVLPVEESIDLGGNTRGPGAV